MVSNLSVALIFTPSHTPQYTSLGSFTFTVRLKVLFGKLKSLKNKHKPGKMRKFNTGRKIQCIECKDFRSLNWCSPILVSNKEKKLGFLPQGLHNGT